MKRTFYLKPLSTEQLTQIANRENQQARILANDWSHEFLTKLPVLKKPAKLVMEFVHVGDLGLPENATWWDILQSAVRIGAVSLPLNAVLQLRYAYQDQPVDEFLRLVHAELRTADQRHRFALYNNGQKLFVSARECGDALTVWPRSCLFGFMKSFSH